MIQEFTTCVPRAQLCKLFTEDRREGASKALRGWEKGLPLREVLAWLPVTLVARHDIIAVPSTKSVVAAGKSLGRSVKKRLGLSIPSSMSQNVQSCVIGGCSHYSVITGRSEPKDCRADYSAGRS